MDDDALEEDDKVEIRSYFLEGLIILMVVFMIFIYFSSRFFVVIPAGHQAIYFSTLGEGTLLDKHFDEGLNVKFPWDYVVLYNTRIQEHQDTILGLTVDGLEVYAEISFRYFPDAERLGLLHREIGPDYLNTILIPQITAITRDIISRYDVNQLYSTSRDSIQRDMADRSVQLITDHYPINVIDVVVRSIILPEKVMEAIRSKLVYEQDMLAYEFRLELERREALRKEIEAQGIRAFTDTSQIDILKWEGITATKELAKSPNSKVVVIGTDSGDLPIILGGNN